MNGLDLFSGIGGLALALDEWVNPIADCERDRYAQSVLLSRMRSGQLPVAPIWDDVQTLNGSNLPEPVDIITGGFPCQDISAAGLGAGLGGERSGLFQHIVRLVEETNPRFVFLENVPAIRTRGLNSVAQAFTDIGYDFRWTVVSAKEVGACHIRKRWFGLAHANSTKLRLESGRSGRPNGQAEALNGVDGSPWGSADANGPGLERVRRRESRITRPVIYNGWVSQPTICRGINGLPHRVDRTKGLGNSVVPLQAKEAFMRLGGLA